MRKRLIAAVALATLSACPALARGPEAPTPMTELVVTANRAPTPLSQVGQSVTVLDAATIRDSQAVSVADLLVRTPGVSLSSAGGLGAQTSVRIRGADSDQTVVLIDGVKLTDPSQPAGGFDFENLLVGDIDRIEILRGPQSTLWGADAIGGVINIVTAQPAARHAQDLQIEAGSRDTAYLRAGIGGTAPRLTWRLAASALTTRGISSLDSALGGRETDPYRALGFTGSARVALPAWASLDLRAYYADGRKSFDGFPPPAYQLADTPEYQVLRQFVSYTGLTLPMFGDRLTNRFAYQHTDTRADDYDPSLSVPKTFQSDGRNDRFEYQGTWALAPKAQAVFGAETERSSYRTASPSPFDPNPAPDIAHGRIDSLYGQIQAVAAPGLTLTAGARRDHHQTLGSHTTAQLSAAWALNGGSTLLRASFGQGFKAPSLFQLYSLYGNLGLQPGTADGWEAGVTQALLGGRATFSASYFSRTARNLIGFQSCYLSADPRCPSHPFGFYNNILRSTARGVELAGQVRLGGGLSLSGDYSHTESVDRSPGSPVFGRDLARRPRDMANATASYRWSTGATAAVAARYAGRSFEDAADSIVLKRYAVIDLRAALPLGGGIEVYGRIENLLGRRYETVFQYGQPGRGVFAGLRARF